LNQKIQVSIPIVGEEEISEVIKVLKSGQYVSGKYVKEFEKQFAEYIGVKYAIACNSGTSALHMAYLSLAFDSDSYFVTTPMTFFSTISAGLFCGSRPIFCDVDDRCNMDPTSLEKVLEEHRYADIRAVVPVHFYGHPCEIKEIVRISSSYGIPVVEDCAQAHGADFENQKVGSFGICGCFSFFATKNMTTTEGGIITTNDEDIYQKCILLRSHGMVDRNTHQVLGYNYRMTEIEAAIGLVQLTKLDYLNEIRIRNSLYLQEHIKNPKVKVFRSKSYVKDVYFWQPVFCEESEQFSSWLTEFGIGFRFRYLEPLYRQPIFASNYRRLYLSRSEKFSGHMFGLPNHPALTKEELQKIVDVVNDF